MPELPDLEYIVSNLAPVLTGRQVVGMTVSEPIVVRTLVLGEPEALLVGQRIHAVRRHGPFLELPLTHYVVVVHPMLAGRFRLATADAKPLAHTCVVLDLDDGRRLSYADEKRMGKFAIAAPDQLSSLPGYTPLGVDITTDAFSYEAFAALIAKDRRQVRVFLMDHGKLDSLGNAYADEVLFDAGIHPKAPCSKLNDVQRRRLHESIVRVVRWGIREVSQAGKALEVKVRDHMKVRNRKGRPCPRCGTTIRRASVYGYDTFFCPTCQPAQTKQFIDWNRTPE